MDHPRGIDGNADPLRDLFQERGPVRAPDHLATSVMDRLSALPALAKAKERPLVPTWAWIAGCVLCCVLVLWPQQGTLNWTLPHLPTLRIPATAQWIVSAIACGTALFGLDALLKLQRARLDRA
jgi:hypothetical protein